MPKGDIPSAGGYLAKKCDKEQLEYILVGCNKPYSIDCGS